MILQVRADNDCHSDTSQEEAPEAARIVPDGPPASKLPSAVTDTAPVVGELTTRTLLMNGASKLTERESVPETCWATVARAACNVPRPLPANFAVAAESENQTVVSVAVEANRPSTEEDSVLSRLPSRVTLVAPVGIRLPRTREERAGPSVDHPRVRLPVWSATERASTAARHRDEPELILRVSDEPDTQPEPDVRDEPARPEEERAKNPVLPAAPPNIEPSAVTLSPWVDGAFRRMRTLKDTAQYDTDKVRDAAGTAPTVTEAARVNARP